MTTEPATALSSHAARTPLAGLVPPLLFCAHAFAAAPAADRVVQPVDPEQRVTLSERRAAWISPTADEGPVPDNLSLAHLVVMLKRSPERQQAFERLLEEQQDPASTNYHRWLTPTEIGERFGATRHDIDAVSGWLRSQGLDVDGVSNSRTRIRFSGTAAAIASAFRTNLRYYRAGGAKRIANATGVEIPATLADAISAVSGLETIRYRSALRTSSPRSRPLAPAASHPAASNCSGSTCSYAIFPADFAKIYNVRPVYDAGYRGSGQAIAIVGRARVYDQDVSHFQDLAALPSRQPTVIIPPDGADPGAPLTTCADDSDPYCGHDADDLIDQLEATLDVQRAGSVAPDAPIKLVISDTVSSVDGVNIALDYAIDTDPVPAKVLSISFASCEADNSSAVARWLDDFFAQAAAEGISVFVASGDAGVAGCASLDAAPQPGEPETTNILCSSQHVTCVGGTEFADKDDPDTYWSRSNGADFLSALGYIPEGAWNEPLDRSGNPRLAASGGGVSAYIPTPSWQTGPGVPGRAGRYTPDVSLHASTEEGYFTCIAAQGGPCTVSASGRFTFILGGGTSASAPSFAGIAALLNQKTGSAQGNLNPRLYSLAASAGSSVFHDITVASSGVSNCTLAVPSLCNNSTPGPNGLSGGLSGYKVGPGYDLATGLGSVNATSLLARWNGNAAPVNLNQAGLTGSWYNPATSGQGVVMQVVPDLYGPGAGLLFGGWFTFDVTAAGGQRWYSVQGRVSESDSATMPIYQSEGGNFDAPPIVGVTEVGEATFTFSDCTHGTLTYAFDDGSGRSGSIPLTRLGNNVACEPGGNATPPGAYFLSGAWYDPATAGQGFVFDIDPVAHTLFAAWYTYATNGQQIGGGSSQRWYSLQSAFTPGASSIDDIAIFRTTGGAFDDPHAVTTTQVGTATLDFHGCVAATLSYRFTTGENAGRTGTIPLARTTMPPASCGL